MAERFVEVLQGTSYAEIVSEVRGVRRRLDPLDRPIDRRQ
jgi:hypothetical protein